MGVLTDFVVANSSDAKEVADCLDPSGELGGVAAKGIDQVKMGTLYAILTGTEYDPEFMLTDDSFLHTADEDGSWVQLVPPDMVSRLSSLSDSEIPRISKEWGQTEEFDPKYCGWSSEDIESFLQEIAGLSRRARSEGKSVLMWTSL